MFLLVKEIDGENIIIGSAHKRVSVESSEAVGIRVFEIPDEEFKPEMIHSILEYYEEDE